MIPLILSVTAFSQRFKILKYTLIYIKWQRRVEFDIFIVLSKCFMHIVLS